MTILDEKDRSVRISNLNFHFEKPPIFTARQYGATRWIEVADGAKQYERLAIFVDECPSFEALTGIAAAMTAAWSVGEGGTLADAGQAR